MANVKSIPEGYPRVSPHLSIAGAAEAIDFYVSILGATERMRMARPDGVIVHAEIDVGNSVVMMADEAPGSDPSPKTLGGSTVSLYAYVDDVDGVYERAVKNGAEGTMAPETQFYGDRTARIIDPWGHYWNLATHVEDVPPDEMGKRAAEALGG